MTKKERPIPFSAPMIRALLAGTKTQTRRALRVQPPAATVQVSTWHHPDERPHFYAWVREEAANPSQVFDGAQISDWDAVPCPYGQPGDRLWVREAWYCDDYRVQRGPYLKPDDMDLAEARSDGTLIYRASSGDRPYEAEQPVWRPSIHMPRWASRITLEVTEVRVERLQDISESDARAEGFDLQPRLAGYSKDSGCRWAPQDPREAFCHLWESINGDFSWAANPWVWVVDFRHIPN